MHRNLPLALTLSLAATLNAAEPTLTVEHTTADFAFGSIPTPAVDDAAASAGIELLSGQQDPNGAPLSALVDGKLPASPDDPRANFFFRAGSDGGRFVIDLARQVNIGSVTTYSWHRTDRAPQVYTIYAAADASTKPARPTDPATAGWTKLADVDTRIKDRGTNTQHAARISGSIGTYRYLLIDTRPTGTRDPFGHTFFSEIDVTEKGAPAPERFKPATRIVETFASDDKKLSFTIDSTRAPDLTAWARDQLAPVVLTWYPKIVAMLPSDGFTAHDTVHLEFKSDMPRGVPAYASGNRVSLSADFYRGQLDTEAKGCAVHELVHVVQQYGRARRTPRATRTPGWVTEGTADYIRWFLYEPEKNGARITKRNLLSASYDASYRTTANFIDYVVQNHDPDKTLLENLNAAAREGRYTDDLWEAWTGHPLDDLNTRWLQHHRQRLLAE